MADRRRRRRRLQSQAQAEAPARAAPAPRPTRPAWGRLTRRQLALLLVFGLGLIPVEFYVLQQVLERPPGESTPEVAEIVLDGPDSPHALYTSIPPTSGPHVAKGAPWGVNEEPVPNELQVANLAEGGVIVQYNCPRGTSECEELVGKLTSLYAERYEGRKVLVAPGPAVADARIALTAWLRLQKLDAYREKTVTDFIDAFLDKRDQR